MSALPNLQVLICVRILHEDCSCTLLFDRKKKKVVHFCSGESPLPTISSLSEIGRQLYSPRALSTRRKRCFLILNLVRNILLEIEWIFSKVIRRCSWHLHDPSRYTFLDRYDGEHVQFSKLLLIDTRCLAMYSSKILVGFISSESSGTEMNPNPWNNMIGNNTTKQAKKLQVTWEKN